MPVDLIPDPGILPEYSWGVYSRNKVFTGRAESLKALAQKIKGHDAVAIGEVTVTGLGGIGKSQLANQFVHCYGKFFMGGVFWVSFTEPETIMTGIAECGKAMALHPLYHEFPIEEQVRMVREAWQHEIPRLLIFDNCEDEALLQWRPIGGGCRLLITSRKQEWSKSLNLTQHPLDLLNPEESVQLLCKLCPALKKDQKTLFDIAEEVGHLPLALHLTGSYLHCYRDITSPKDYLIQLRKEKISHPAMTGKAARDQPTAHVMHVAKTFQLSLKKLNPKNLVDASALRIFYQVSYLAPGEPIPMDLLLKLGGVDHETIDGLNKLLDLGLLEIAQDESIVCHRLLVFFAEKVRVTGSNLRDEVDRIILIEADKIIQGHDPTGLSSWLGHLLFLRDASVEQSLNVGAIFCKVLGNYYQKMGYFHLAQKQYQTALEWVTLHQGRESVASYQTDLGLLLQEMGDLPGARDLLTQALTKMEANHKSGDPTIAKCQTNLGAVLGAMGKLPAARDLLERALMTLEEAFPKGHLDIAACQSKLGMVLKEMGDLPRARVLLEDALETAIINYEFGHLTIAVRQLDLAKVLMALDDLPTARKLSEEALKAVEITLPEGHPNISVCQSNLASVLKDMGDFSGVCELFEKALVSAEAALPKGHPTIAGCQSNYALLLKDIGDLPKAQVLLEQALAADLESFGPDHPTIGIRQTNLGLVLQKKGDLPGARNHLEAALVNAITNFEDEHPSIAISQSNLAVVLYELGDLPGARGLLNQALKNLSKNLGVDHSSTTLVQSNLSKLNGMRTTCD